MKKLLLAGTAVLVIGGSTMVYAQHFHGPGRHFNMRLTQDDMSAFADARIAAVRAGLRLTAEQEKLWPPVEAAARDLAKLRIDRLQARRDAPPPDDLMARMRARSDAMSANAEAFKRTIDATDPLYKTLSEDQKRRLAMLTRIGGRVEEWRRQWNNWRGGPEFDRDRGWDRGGRGMDDRPRRSPMSDPSERL